MNNPVWPYGSGGACGEQFAATQEKMLRDIAALGLRKALDLWTRGSDPYLGSWARIGVEDGGVLTEADICRMERAA